jgi:O-antigen/teichoic acid export membrane protein
MTDQALSSLTNAALAILVARSVSSTAFGAFSVALITFSFVIGISRAVITEPLVIRFSAAEPRALVAAVRQAAGAALLFGAAAGSVCALVGVLLPTGQAGTALLALSVSLPGLLVQDTWRFGFFAAGRPGAATVNDLVWAVVQFALVGALLTSGRDSVLLITLAWGAAALVAAVVGCVQLRALPAPRAARAWLRSSPALSARLGADYVLNMGSVNLAMYLVGVVVGLAAVGALRAAQVLLGPLHLAFSGLSSFVLPVFSRRAADRQTLNVPALAASGSAALVAVVWVLGLLLLPQSVGVQLLGDSWSGARAVLLPSGIVMIAIAAAMGASLGLKALRRADLLLVVTAVQAPLIVGLGLLGAYQAGARGAAIGFAVAQIIGAVLSWLAFRRGQTSPGLHSSGQHRMNDGPSGVIVTRNS